VFEVFGVPGLRDFSGSLRRLSFLRRLCAAFAQPVPLQNLIRINFFSDSANRIRASRISG
jgi:hypothetical protein